MKIDVRALRGELTQLAFAEKIGVSRLTITRAEASGRVSPQLLAAISPLLPPVETPQYAVPSYLTQYTDFPNTSAFAALRARAAKQIAQKRRCDPWTPLVPLDPALGKPPFGYAGVAIADTQLNSLFWDMEGAPWISVLVRVPNRQLMDRGEHDNAWRASVSLWRYIPYTNADAHWLRLIDQERRSRSLAEVERIMTDGK
jgi:DNA-binding XRE family transcriptional regulator